MLVKGAPLTLASPLSGTEKDFLTAAQSELKRQWADRLKVTKATKKVRWWQIVGGVSPKGTYGMSQPRDWPATPPAWDHASIWVRNGTPIVAVSQPYPWLLTEKIESLNEFASEYGFRFKVSNYLSWHYPSRCWFIEWYGKDSVGCDLTLL